ncbi:MAG TPA: PLP-dependent aminotransferase family protein [Cyclobacteriaceae bacterium]|nr:PLP-dependent aminotransferase family protein [Cyclobacteriaceae bacterium]HMV09743.1 PLP-dependent aminotransferase family protein [Cyclobacteriaceae bacterium]HMV90475.1 PLP-dependent aminotransferase family protein [Cyclobacteriaceae bacterium]HMX02296.1 PLP-dependent aminotransferase family protein [Cyclobacteriaceae bacterium]HMX51163.1 PLP-dependent aminotransferase family protein [Cyclobacteriaceae bacterium]
MKTVVRQDHKYIDVSDRIEKLIDNGVLKVGDKLLSVRALSKEQGISLSTAFQSYYHLESKGLIEARPQSGYYVKFSREHILDLPKASEPPDDAVPVSVDEMISSVYHDLNSEKLIHFSLGVPSIELLPAAKLTKSVMQAIRDSKTSCMQYEHIQGNLTLRRQIARQAFNWGGTPTEDEIVVTAGCVEALSLCIKATTKPGDAVAIESPTYFAIFQVMESHGLKVVEIPTDPVTGIDLNYLEQAIPKFDIKACLFVNNFNNPLGSCMPDENKKQLVDMLARKEIPLIEDDIYGEMYFGKNRPKTCKTFDKKGLVLHCSSFSKSLAPGHRIGWTMPGRFKEKVIRLKRMHTVSTNTLSQAAIAHFLSNGRYELHLRHLRKALHTQSLRYIQAICEYFPDDTKMTRPQGGFALWIELNKKINTYKLHKKALKHNIGVAPGQIFSSQARFENCLRLSYGEPWSPRIEDGIKTLGKLVKEMK